MKTITVFCPAAFLLNVRLQTLLIRPHINSHPSRKWPGLDKKLYRLNLSTNVCSDLKKRPTLLLHPFLIQRHLYVPSIVPYLAEGWTSGLNGISLPKKKIKNKNKKGNARLFKQWINRFQKQMLATITSTPRLD